MDDSPSFVFDGPTPFDGPTSQAACNRLPGGPTCAGCCNVDGDCITTESNDACGTGGEACLSCAANESCTGGTCVRPQPGCDPSSCAGCCRSDSVCAVGSQNAACGQAGEACASCAYCFPAAAGGGSCANASCNGCSDSPSHCADGLSQDKCGLHGEPCHACTGGQQCAPASTAGGICQDAGACGPQNCPGCCQGAVCLYGNQDLSCGAGGSVCANCFMYGWTCVSGACQ